MTGAGDLVIIAPRDPLGELARGAQRDEMIVGSMDHESWKI